MNNNDCPVCYRFFSVHRDTIRKFVIEESMRRGGAKTSEVKKALCKKCKHVGFSARSQTVGEAGITSGTTEAGEVRHKPPLPTLSDFGARHRSHHEYNVRRLRREKLRRTRRKFNRP